MANNKYSIRLNSGTDIPIIGLGTWQSKPGEVGKAIDIAIRAGYRHIDGAFIYNNEKEIGESLQTLYKEGVVKREDLFITSKLSSYHMASEEDVIECCEESLEYLQTSYLDLFLIHGPIGLKKGVPFAKLQKSDISPYSEEKIAVIWKAMEDLVHKGKVKSIGISNFTITKTDKLLKTAKIVPAVNQVECHVYFQQPKLREYMKSKGIAVQAYAPVGSPSRSMGIDPNDPVLLEDPVINEIASKHQATAAQVCISYLLHLGMIALPKSVTESRIHENIRSSEISLDDEDMKRLRELDRNLRWFTLNNIFKLDNLWDIEEDEAFVL